MSKQEHTLQALKAKVSPSPEYLEVVDELTGWLNKVATELLVNVVPSIELGFSVTAGQQFKLGVKGVHVYQVLLKAYVPPTGYPVRILCSGKERVVLDLPDLIRFLYEETSQEDALIDQLRAFYCLLI